ncbi:transcription intermediary factor 1-beta-like isoform X2 [Haliotis rubra]|uniref:transcription intermediary factor 1-beta-like isoform X2 n=1 Tax=Haliotis rubra TaxID=36100 RepID=UPI001EE615BA|nr:transcription intermediary factor 1-beta-like isoform X2 [Haliotis rubra]
MCLTSFRDIFMLLGSTETVCQFSTQSCCDESQLRLLPCLHSACKPCLDHQATQAEETYIHCPSCGPDFTMEQTTVDHVRRNEAAYKVNADGEMKCSYIDEDHDAKAVVYCHECDDKLCSDCHKLHDKPKRNRNHRVTEVNQSKNIPMKQWLKEHNCRDHPANKLQLYDHTCKKAVCRVCELGAHNKHKNEDLNQAYDVAKGQLEKQVKKQQHKLKDVTSRMKTVTSHQTELGTTQRRLEQVATKVCKSVAARFLHRQRQLMEDIQVSLQSPYRLVQEKLDTLHNVHTSIVSAIDYTQRTLELTRREELITLTDVLQTKCDDNLKRGLPEDDTQDTKILLTFQGQKALTELIDTFGGLVPSLNVDHIPDKQPTLQDLQKWNMQLTLKEENTRKVHEGRWHQLGEIIHRITAGTVSRTSKSQGLRPEQLTSQEVASEQLTPQEVEPEKLKSQDVFQAAKHFILGAFAPLETPERGLCLKGYSGTVHIRRRRGRSKFITCK